MATNYGTPCENENYGGMCRIYVDLYRDLLWAVFIDKVPILVLVSELAKILANPRRFRYFHHQFKRLLDVYASTGTINNTDCDISVIYSLFRNIPTSQVQPPTQGWGKVPQPGDVGVTDDLERIHHGRNKLIGHAGEASITDADFTAQLSDIKNIVTRLDGHLGSSYLLHLQRIESDCHSSKGHLNHYDEYLKELERQQDAEAGLRDLVEEKKQAIRDVSSQFEATFVAQDTSIAAQHTRVASKDTEFDKGEEESEINLPYLPALGTSGSPVNMSGRQPPRKRWRIEPGYVASLSAPSYVALSAPSYVALSEPSYVPLRLPSSYEALIEPSSNVVLRKRGMRFHQSIVSAQSSKRQLVTKGVNQAMTGVGPLQGTSQQTNTPDPAPPLQDQTNTPPTSDTPPPTTSAESLLLLYAELKDKLRRDQCRTIAKDIAAERILPAEEKAYFQEMTKRRDLVVWLLKHVLNQKDDMIFKIFCKSLGKQSPSLGQTLQETSVHKHELVKTERQPTTIQLEDLHFLQSSFISKLVVDIIIDKLLSRFLITVEEHSSIRSSSDEAEMIKRLEVLLQYDKEIMQQFELITQSFRNASVSKTADWLVPLHALAKETLSCGKGLAIATDIFQQIPGIISPSDLYELYKLKDNSRGVIDRLLKHIYRHPRPEMFDVICYSLEDHDEDLYEHFLRIFFFKGCDKEKTKPVVKKDSTMRSRRGTDHLDNILWNSQTLDVVIDHLLSSFCITVDQHSDIRDAGSIRLSIKKLVELLKRSSQMIMDVNAILRHLDKIADTTHPGNKEITIKADFGDPEVNSQARKYMDSLCGQTLTLADIGQFYLNDVNEGSVAIKISPLDRESLRRFRDMEMDGTILRYLRDHVKEFLPDDVEVDLSELSIEVKERTTRVPVQSASIINASIELSSGEVYTMKNEPFVQQSFQGYPKCIGSIWMFPPKRLSRETKSNSSDRGLVFAGRLGSRGEPLAIKRMLLRNYSGRLKTYETVKERLQHTNIVKIFCVEKDKRYGYVAMERMDENLVEYVARSGQNRNPVMGTEEEIYYMKHIVTGLAFIHEEGFLHNMFSPRAILLKKNNPDTQQKQVRIACFSDAALCENVPVSCSKGANDVLALIKVILFVLSKKEAVANGDIQTDKRIIESGHFDISILLQKMLDSMQSDELKLHEFALHPTFSSPSVQLHFLKESSRLRRKLKVDFNSTNRTSVNGTNPWLNEPTLTRNVYQYLINHGYKPHCLNSLVRCIRNCHEHLPDIMLQVQQEFGAEERYIYYWLVKFPGLVSSVYEAMTPHMNHTDLVRFFPIER